MHEGREDIFAVINWIFIKTRFRSPRDPGGRLVCVFPHNMASAEALASVARPQQHLMGGDFVLDPVRLQSYKIQNDFGIFDFLSRS